MSRDSRACQAIVDDVDHPTYHAPMQHILAPGSKRCSRMSKDEVKHLGLCAAHARMARAGLVAYDGRVAPRADIAAVRRYPKKFPKGLPQGEWAFVSTKGQGGSP